MQKTSPEKIEFSRLAYNSGMPRKAVKYPVVIIFPYLFVYDKEGFEFEKLVIKPSYDDIISQEKKETRENLLDIAGLFRFGHDKQICQWSYALTHISSQKQWDDIKNKLNKFATILRYSRLRDRKEHSRFDNLNFCSHY